MLLTACGQSAQTPTVADEPEDTAPVVVEPEQEDAAAEPLVFSDQPANVFRAKFEGSNVAGKGEAVDGVYRFTATKTDGEAWHVKLESNYMTVPGRDYRVTYHFKSDVAGTVKFGDFQEFAIRKGENTVTGQVSAVNGYTYLDLQLGALKPFTIDFTSIEVDEMETEADYENVMTVPIAWSSEGAVYVQHDPGYFYKLDRHVDGVTMKVEEIPFSAEVWMSRLYVKTAAILEPGALYRVSADVSATHEMDMEVCFNNGDNEKGYGAFYGQRMGDMSKRTFQQLIDLRSPGSEGGEVVLQFAFGKSPDGSQVTVDNIRVEKVHEHYTNMLPVGFAMNASVPAGLDYTDIPKEYTPVALNQFSYDGVDSVYELHEPEYTTALHEAADSATLDIVTSPAPAPDSVWKVKLFVDTGVKLQADKAYRISADVSATKDFGYELCYNNGGTEKGVGALYGLAATADAKTIVYEVTGKDADLVLQFALGNAASGTSVTVKNVKVEALTGVKSDVTWNSTLAYPNTTDSNDNLFLLETVDDLHNNNVGATMERKGNGATVIVNAPGADWHIKFYVRPGQTLAASKTYVVAMDVDGGATGHTYTACYKSTGNGKEDGFGTETIGASGTVYHVITPDNGNAGDMEIVLKLGALPGGTAVTVNNVRIYEQKNNNYDFNLVQEAGSNAHLVKNGQSATATITTPHADWHVKLFGLPGGEKVYAGNNYLIAVDVGPSPEFPVVYKSWYESDPGRAEDVLGNETVAASDVQRTVWRPFSVTEGTAGEPQIVMKIGALPANTEVAVSNVRLLEEIFASPAAGNGNNFSTEFLWGTAGTMTGDGNSATATVDKPGADWHVKFYAKPDVTLVSGKTYEISMDVAGATGYTAFYKSVVHGGEDSLGKEDITATGTVSKIVKPDDTTAGKFEILCKLGALPQGSKVTISNIQVHEVVMTPGENQTANLKYDSVGSFSFNADGGYKTKLTQAADSVAFVIDEAPAERHPWNVKLNVGTGFVPQNGQYYQVKFDIKAEKSQRAFEVFYDGKREEAYGAVRHISLTGGEWQTVSTYVQGFSDQGELKVQIRLGETDDTSGNSYTIRNVQVEKVTFETLVRTAYREATELWTHEDYAGTLITTGYSASARLTKTPAQGKEAWKTKLFVETGAKLQAGQKYRITFTVVGSNGMPYEICLNNGGEEKGLGGIFGLSGNPGGEPITYVTTPDKDIDLVLQFSLGNAASGNTLTVRNLRVEKAGASSLVSHTTYTF